MQVSPKPSVCRCPKATLTFWEGLELPETGASGSTFGDHTFRKCLHLQTSKPKLGEAREALNDHVHRCVDVQFLAVSHVELGEWQLPHTCNTQCQIKALGMQMLEG